MNDTELLALVAVVNAEVAEIEAANKQREVQGCAMAYDGFLDSSGALEAITKELQRRKILL